MCMRLKSFFYGQESNKYMPENYGLKILNCQPKSKEITNFENYLTNLLKNIKFCSTKSYFQQNFRKT